MSAGMIRLRGMLSDKYGSDDFGRIMLMQMCQERGLNPVVDEPTSEMWGRVA